jgi:glutaconate CoA-transferase subunit B
MIMKLSKRAFVPKLDFVTSPGHLDGGNARERLGMPGRGPDLVITDKGLFNFDNPEREMMLVELAPGATVDSVRAEVGWPLRAAESIHSMLPPDESELRVLREDLDPQGLYR